MSESFYAKMPAFTNFADLTQIENFQEVPSDWVVIITDVRGSTKAIEAGRYKDVNTIGAATIVSLNNVMEDGNYPFVFGGDGATAVIPKSQLPKAQKELTGLSQLSEKKFNLTLRIGMVTVQELVEEGSKLLVAKYALSSGVKLAIFQGGALALAEEKIKKEEEKYSILLQEEAQTDLALLSCRWEPLPSQKGRVLSLLVLIQPNQGQEVYNSFLTQLAGIIGSLEKVNPVSLASMKFDLSITRFLKELRFQTGLWRTLKRLFIASYTYFGVWSRIANLLPAPKNFLHKTPTHSDYHKFDEMLRMVIDVTPQQAQKIQELCQDFHQQQKIFYGIHLSNHALMTCVASSYQDGTHIHFIDGGDGGYAMAAKQLKGQL